MCVPNIIRAIQATLNFVLKLIQLRLCDLETESYRYEIPKYVWFRDSGSMAAKTDRGAR